MRTGLLLLLCSVFGVVIQASRAAQETCLECHTKEKLDPAHDAKVIGCTPCHLGDPLAIDKDKAHQGMVINPLVS